MFEKRAIYIEAISWLNVDKPTGDRAQVWFSFLFFGSYNYWLTGDGRVKFGTEVNRLESIRFL